MPYYFAYGSNMSPRQMQRRCPGARAVGPVRLLGWKFIITTRGGANVVKSPGHVVQGVLWQVTTFHLAKLDRWEGVSSGVYRRTRVPVEGSSHHKSAVVYVADRRWPGRSRTDYMLTAILPGAVAFGMDGAYRAELAGWLPRRPIGPIRTPYRGRRSRARPATVARHKNRP